MLGIFTVDLHSGFERRKQGLLCDQRRIRRFAERGGLFLSHILGPVAFYGRGGRAGLARIWDVLRIRVNHCVYGFDRLSDLACVSIIWRIKFDLRDCGYGNLGL